VASVTSGRGWIVGREAVPWDQQVWDGLDRVVHEEVKRSAVGAALLPLVGPLPGALTVPADVIDADRLAIPEDAVTPVVELSVEFTLTPTQVESETRLLTGSSLATRAANLLAQAEDALVFQGDTAAGLPVFRLVNRRQSAGPGLVGSAQDEIVVAPASGEPGRYGENTFAAVVEGYSRLEGRGHYGPFALALHDEVYADTFAPLTNTLISPADRIRPLVTAGFVGLGTLSRSTGVLFSIGGNTIDVILASEPATTFSQVDEQGLFRFRVAERFCLRVKDRTAIVRLRFAEGSRTTRQEG
jgi:uncharacterized linocin/CFP29 family protein